MANPSLDSSERLAQQKAAIKAWVVKESGKIAADQLGDDTPLIEQRLITSLQVLDLILYLERIRGKPVAIEALAPGSFRTLREIYRNFLDA